MKLKLQFTFIVLAFLVSQLPLNGQIALNNVSQFEKFKSGTTYVIIKDTNNIQAQKFMSIYRNFWYFNQIKFIPLKDVSNYKSENCMFISINSMTISSKNKKNTNIFLTFWAFDTKTVNSKSTNIDFVKQVQLGRIDLYTDFVTLDSPSKISTYKYSGNNHFRNWGLGYLKNYLQEFQRLISLKNNVALTKSKHNELQLSFLKNKILFVPEYLFTKFDHKTGSEEDFVDEIWLFENYAGKYKVLSSKELNNKILTDKHPFYYLQYVKSGSNKFVYIVNSHTGEIVYHKQSNRSYNLEQKDIDRITEKIHQ